MKISKKDMETARRGYNLLTEKKSARKSGSGFSNVVLQTDDKTFIQLPPQAVEAVAKVLERLSKGEEIAFAAEPSELSTQKAAEYLKVSRPFLIGLLEKGEIPFRKVGTHRRIEFAHLKIYKEETDAKRMRQLEELAKQAQELDMGY